jgi:myb proto-oncogene protein
MADWTQLTDDDLSKDVASLRAVLSESASSSFPAEPPGEEIACSAVAELQICLSKNIALQSLLGDKLREIEDALADNEENLRELERLEGARRSLRKGILSVWRMKRNDYFRDHKGQTPPSLRAGNQCADQLGNAVYSANMSWRGMRSEKADVRLTEGVRRQITDTLTQPLQASLKPAQDPDEKLRLRRQIQAISKRPIQELLREEVPVDWSLLAYEQFNALRTASDCELRWKGHTHPAVKKGPWTADEDKSLEKIAQEHEFRDWSLIAAELGTGRTGFQCLQHYQQKLNPSMSHKVFTTEDDTLLTEAVKIYGDSRWNMVAAYVGSKTSAQVMHRWINTLKPGIKKGRWEREEDQVRASSPSRPSFAKDLFAIVCGSINVTSSSIPHYSPYASAPAELESEQTKASAL